MKTAPTNKAITKKKKPVSKPKASSKVAAARQEKSVTTTATAKAPRPGTKKALVLDLLQRKGGVTRTELAEATGWSGPFVHGFISWTVKKIMAVPVVSTKTDDGERTYTLSA